MTANRNPNENPVDDKPVNETPVDENPVDETPVNAASRVEQTRLQVETLSAELVNARQAAADAQAAVETARSRARAGTASGTEMSEARSRAELTAERVIGLEEALSQARADHRAATVVNVVESVERGTVTPPNLEHVDKTESENVSEIIGRMLAASAARDALSDELGETLHRAGVPINTDVGRVRYAPITNGIGTRNGSGWNVSIDGEWISRRQGHGYTRRADLRRVEASLTVALKAHGIRWNGSLSSL